ncbi:DUF6300 family protein [Streptomyces sp. NPDC060209]|uniref:DUF6300 family protein n=1 Tax=Streptomyces sp. NPDC060209 TaxID=3347073 RepID=UPI00364D75DC
MTEDAAAPVVQIDNVPLCPRCEAPGLMLARFPSSWKNEQGTDVDGFKEALLCTGCDATDPAATDLLALFTVDGWLSPENLALFTELAAAWIAVAALRKVHQRNLTDEVERFRRGEL